MARRGQGNFKLAANFGYSSRGSADPRESLRKRRILKLALTAHKVSCHPGSAFLLLVFAILSSENTKVYVFLVTDRLTIILRP